MSLHPKVKLAQLRAIGWRLWDPIGLLRADGAVDEACADEYDSYLLHVVSLICRGASKAEAASYLDGIAADHMGLGPPRVSNSAATSTVNAIADYLLSLPDGPASVRE